MSEVTGGSFEACEPENAEWLRCFVGGLFDKLQNDAAKMSSVIQGLKAEAEAVDESARSLHQKFCLTLIEQYGEDVGVVFVFLMNILCLKTGDWFLIDAGVPHAYLQGELMECMINSDNVVRGGLTNKLKDSGTLCEILPYEARSAPQVWQGNLIQQEEGSFEVREFLTEQFKELCILRIEISVSSTAQVELPRLALLGIFIVLSGQGQVKIQNEAMQQNGE